MKIITLHVFYSREYYQNLKLKFVAAENENMYYYTGSKRTWKRKCRFWRKSCTLVVYKLHYRHVLYELRCRPHIKVLFMFLNMSVCLMRVCGFMYLFNRNHPYYIIYTAVKRVLIQNRYLHLCGFLPSLSKVNCTIHYIP